MRLELPLYGKLAPFSPPFGLLLKVLPCAIMACPEAELPRIGDSYGKDVMGDLITVLILSSVLSQRFESSPAL